MAEEKLPSMSFVWRTDNPGFYYWRVAGIDADGDRGPFSEFNTFAIKADRNKAGDETTFDTYRLFDPYSPTTQKLRILWAPTFEPLPFRTIADGCPTAR